MTAPPRESGEDSAEADGDRQPLSSPAADDESLAIFRRARGERMPPAYADGAMVGDVIGDFRLLVRVASGGQGEVWEAEQLSLHRRVALKLVRPDRINETTLALFAREARAGGRLAHPGVVAVHGYGQDDGRHWISQEFIEGAWTLRVTDGVDRDQGTLDHWAVELYTRPHEDPLAEVLLRTVDKGESGNVLIEWWPVGTADRYIVYRSGDPSSWNAFTDVTPEDPDDSDTTAPMVNETCSRVDQKKSRRVFTAPRTTPQRTARVNTQA